MTTPQNKLFMLGQRIRHIADLFEDDEDGNNLFDSVKKIESQMQDIADAKERQENLMNVIVKLLSKDG